MSENTLKNRKGILILNREMVLNSSEQTLKEIFSNFFPVAIDHFHRLSFYDSIMYMGVSPLFEELEDGCVAPEYNIVLEQDEKGNVKFVEFIQIQ